MLQQCSDAYSEPYQPSKMKLLAKIVRQGSEYVSAILLARTVASLLKINSYQNFTLFDPCSLGEIFVKLKLSITEFRVERFVYFTCTLVNHFSISKVRTQPAFTCSKPTMETPEQYVKYAQSQP